MAGKRNAQILKNALITHAKMRMIAMNAQTRSGTAMGVTATMAVIRGNVLMTNPAAASTSTADTSKVVKRIARTSRKNKKVAMVCDASAQVVIPAAGPVAIKTPSADQFILGVQNYAEMSKGCGCG